MKPSLPVAFKKKPLPLPNHPKEIHTYKSFFLPKNLNKITNKSKTLLFKYLKQRINLNFIIKNDQ